jgi:hypothetical protein
LTGEFLPFTQGPSMTDPPELWQQALAERCLKLGQLRAKRRRLEREIHEASIAESALEEEIEAIERTSTLAGLAVVQAKRPEGPLPGEAK